MILIPEAVRARVLRLLFRDEAVPLGNDGDIRMDGHSQDYEPPVSPPDDGAEDYAEPWEPGE